jgi:hypothetical protein
MMAANVQKVQEAPGHIPCVSVHQRKNADCGQQNNQAFGKFKRGNCPQCGELFLGLGVGPQQFGGQASHEGN